jgi:Na+/proline symporter
MIGTYVALVILAVLTVALALQRRPKTNEDFLIKERKVGTLEMVAAIFTLLGGGEFVTLTALTYVFGIWSILYFVGIAVGFIILAALSSAIRSEAAELDMHSLPDYFARNFGRASSIICTALLCISLGALLQIQFVVGSQIIASLTNVHHAVWVVGMAVLVASYLYISGFRGVLATDFIQSAVMMITLIVLSVYLSPFRGMPLVEQAGSNSIPLGDAVGLLVLGIFAIGGGGDVWQRVYAAESSQAARRGLLLNAIAWLVFGAILVWLAHCIRLRLPSIDPNSAFVEFVTKGLPPSLGPLVALLILSAVMSTADVELFVLSVMLNKEFVRGRSDRASEDKTRYMIVVVSILSAVLAIAARNLVSVYFLILYLLSIIGPVALFRALGRGNSATALVGLIGGTSALLILLASGQMAGWYQLLVVMPALPSLLVKSNGKVSDDGTGDAQVA